jgi:prefoldin subunit 5
MSNKLATLSNTVLYALFPGLKATIDSLTQQVNQLMMDQTDLQTALDAQEVVIKELQAQPAPAPAVDLTPQVQQLEAQTAALQALLPAAPAS